MNDKSSQSDEPPKKQKLLKPSLSFETVTFSDGTRLSFEADEIVVFVGPNNAGKSAALREMESLVGRNGVHTVVKAATFRKSGTADDLKAYLEKFATKRGDSADLVYSGLGYSIHLSHTGYFDQAERHSIAPFLCTRLATESRIIASNAPGAVRLHVDPPQHPIHQLLVDDKLAARINKLFQNAFSRDLVPFRAGGSHFPLLVGKKPEKLAGEDELSKSFVDRLLESTVQLEAQGDGMRSFATVLLYVLASDSHSIQFLDEPEAFLHPPQARLIGEYIARERSARSQLFIATHSTDVLEGLISGGTNKVRIIRIQRDGDVNRVKELSKEKTAAISSDTLARYSGVFEGIFYQHVVICESDADCLFYSSILNTDAVRGEQRPDVLFVHASGKHRLGKLADTLRELNVPVSVIADIDLLNEEAPFRNLFTRLGGEWATISTKWNAIKTSVEARRPPLNADQVVKLINDALTGVGGTAPFGKDKEREIKAIFKTLSSWDDVKRAGRAALPGGQTTQHFDDVAAECAKVGLWLVPVGELEGFCRSIDGGHGPGFVEKVLEERNLESDSELEDARRFITKLWERAKPKT
jgi:predicted ATPase